MESAQQFQKDKKYDEARIQIQAAIELQPRNADVYYQLAEVLLRQQRIAQAVENYNTAINYDPKHRDARLHLAAILLANHQWELAENHIEKLLENNPEDIDVLILKGNYNASGPHKNYDKAKEILTGVLERVPENTAALASLGNIYLVEGKNREAESYLAKALKTEPESAPLQIALADLYARQGRLDDAQKILEKLLEKNSDQAGLHYVFAEFLLNRGLPDKAFEQYSATLKVDPQRHDARDRMYDFYVVRGRIADAKKLTAELIKAFPEDPAVNYFRGRDFELDGKLPDALKSFLESIKLINSFAPAFRHAGIIELKLGKEHEGIEHLNQAVAIDSGEIGARMALAERLFARREMSQAAEHLNQVLNRYPRHLAANVLRADIAMVEGDSQRARTVYQFLVQEFPKDPSGYFKLGLLEEKNGNYEEAIKWYSKTLEFDTSVLLPAERLMRVQKAAKKMSFDESIKFFQNLRNKSSKSKGEYDLLIATMNLQAAKNPADLDRARALYEQSLSENPNLIGAYYGLAQIDAVSGKLDDSVVNYKKLLEKNPKHLPSFMMLALTQERQGKAEEAAQSYRKVLEISPSFAPAANNLAWLIAENLHGDLDEALRLAELAKEQLPKEASVTDTLAWIHFLRGSPGVALPIIEEALELDKLAGDEHKTNPEVLYHAAEIQFATGQSSEAKAHLTQALKNAPANHPKRAKMEELMKKLT